MDLSKNLRERCVVISGKDGDQFVGLKADTDDAKIYFPIGYQLPSDDEELREDIQNLFGVLSALMETEYESKVFTQQQFDEPEDVNFPINSYLKIITDFLNRGNYYIENDPHYKTDIKGKINWSKTIREQQPLIQKDGSLIFNNFTVRTETPNADKQITQIHRYCVYEAFDKLGWIFTTFKPELPGTHPSLKESIYILTQKLSSSYNDNEQELFRAMINLLNYQDEKNNPRKYFFGTDRFDKIWEKMIDIAFGIKNKDEYFPQTKWLLDYYKNKNNKPLQPDSIMIYNGKYYVLDAKFYRYGAEQDPNPDHLPGSRDINKQITYAEFAKKHIEQQTSHKLKNNKLFNAFIMPYNKAKNPFNLNTTIGNIGEAIGSWKTNKYNYERVQGIVIDTNFLMHNYYYMPNQVKQELTDNIEKVLIRGPIKS